MFIMISSKVPFPGKTSKQILKNVLTKEVSFDNQAFIEVSLEAKDLIKRMLDRNVETRISASGIFEHPWMKFFENKALDTDDYFESKQARVQDKKAFNEMIAFGSVETPKLYQMSMLYLANKMDDDSYKMFIRMDKNKDGLLNKEEFKAYLSKLFTEKKMEKFLKRIFDATDQDKDGVIQYREFVAAKLRNTLFKDTAQSTKTKIELNISRHLLDAFSFFDEDNTGYISKANLIMFLKRNALNEEIDESFADYLLAQIDRNHDGRIDIQEFI